MPEWIQITLGAVFLVGMYVLSRYGIVWRIERAYRSVIRDLKARDAVDAASAVELFYAKKKTMNIGIRDFRPKALDELVGNGVVGKTVQGKYYLKKHS